MNKIFKNIAKNVISKNSFLSMLYDRRLNLRTRSAIAEFKDKYKNQRCFIIGNGPSLNRIDLSLLSDEFTFGVNSIFYKSISDNFYPTFFVVEDKHVLRDNILEIKNYKVKNKFFPINYRAVLGDGEGNFFFNMDEGFYNKASKYFSMPRFSRDASKVLYCGQSVTMINLQLAFYMGFTEVYLIGMDHEYIIPKDFIIEGETIISTGSDPNHFHPEYFGAGKKWHDPHLDRVEMTYKFIKNEYEKSSRKIFNATIGGRLELFDRVDFYKLFNR